MEAAGWPAAAQFVLLVVAGFVPSKIDLLALSSDVFFYSIIRSNLPQICPCEQGHSTLALRHPAPPTRGKKAEPFSLLWVGRE